MESSNYQLMCEIELEGMNKQFGVDGGLVSDAGYKVRCLNEAGIGGRSGLVMKTSGCTVPIQQLVTIDQVMADGGAKH